MSRVLVISSQPEVMDALVSSLRRTDVEVAVSFDGTEGLELLMREYFDICYVSSRLPDMEGMEMVWEALNYKSATQFIVVTTELERQQTVSKVWEGAYDYLVLPLDPKEVMLQLNRALGHAELQVENRHLRTQLINKYDFSMLTGTSAAASDLFDMVVRISKTEASVLITGEAGSGKNYIAKTIHYNSPRQHQLFVEINCAAVPNSLLDQELFGSRSKEHISSGRIRPGKLELARGGTVFLEDLDRLHPAIQKRLLQAIEAGEFPRAGGPQTYPLEVRLLASTSVDPEEAIAQGALDKELFEKLCSVRLDIPLLRHRKDDIPVILEHFMSEISEKLGRATPRVSREARDLLLSHNWPGNIRELENVADHAVLMNSSGILAPEDLPESIRSPEEDDTEGCVNLTKIKLSDRGLILKEAVRVLESSLVSQALEKTEWNRSRAAKLLGMKRTTMLEKMKNLGIREIREALHEPDTPDSGDSDDQ